MKGNSKIIMGLLLVIFWIQGIIVIVINHSSNKLSSWSSGKSISDTLMMLIGSILIYRGFKEKDH